MAGTESDSLPEDGLSLTAELAQSHVSAVLGWTKDGEVHSLTVQADAANADREADSAESSSVWGMQFTNLSILHTRGEQQVFAAGGSAVLYPTVGSWKIEIPQGDQYRILEMSSTEIVMMMLKLFVGQSPFGDLFSSLLP